MCVYICIYIYIHTHTYTSSISVCRVIIVMTIINVITRLIMFVAPRRMPELNGACWKAPGSQAPVDWRPENII